MVPLGPCDVMTLVFDGLSFSNDMIRFYAIFVMCDYITTSYRSMDGWVYGDTVNCTIITL